MLWLAGCNGQARFVQLQKPPRVSIKIPSIYYFYLDYSTLLLAAIGKNGMVKKTNPAGSRLRFVLARFFEP